MGHSRPRRVLFRVDASASIGTGHLVRCLALADELARRGIEPSFASSRGAADLSDEVGARGYPAMRLDGGAVDESAAIRMSAVSDGRRRPYGAIVLDHYSLGAEWLQAARQLATRRMVIDDLADRRLPCDLIVNPNLGAKPEDYENLVASATRLLVGIRYALLRPVFRATRQATRRTTGVVRNVLVSMGGSDEADATTAATGAIRAALPAVRIDVVVGALYAGEPVLGPGIQVHRAIDAAAMAKLMVSADLAVGAGGTTAWERCILGLPTVILRLARNQDEVARELDAAGAAVDAGTVEQLDVGALSSLIRQLSDDRSRRDLMSDKARNLVDGRGVERVAHHLEGVRVRRATMGDAELLWRWANDPETRSASFHQESIPYHAHVRWLRDRLADPTCLQLVGWNGAGLLGQVRFDMRDGQAEISIAVASEHRGAVGGVLLQAAVHRFHRESPETNIIARVKVANSRSRHLFEHAGFRLVGDRDGVLQYQAATSAFTGRH